MLTAMNRLLVKVLMKKANA